MEALSLNTILEYSAGALKQGSPERAVRALTTDSRSAKPDELFVAIKGERFGGHQFVRHCAAAGAVGAVIDQTWVDRSLPVDFALIEVPDTLLAYQKIAAAYRRSLPLELIAITGSNGKTSTKDLTAAVLSRRYRVIKTFGNLNNHIGVPQTLLSAGIDDEIAVLEIGMNHPGEIAPLAAMAQPDTAIITNVGTAHIEYMKTREAIALEKGMLAEAVSVSGCVIFPAEDDFAESIAQRTKARMVTVGFQRGDLRAEAVGGDFRGTTFQVVEGAARVDVRLPIPGAHMVLNALLAVAAGRTHGLSLSECVEGLETVQFAKGRLELKSVAGLQIIDDSYNANPDSMVAALKTLARMPTAGRRIAVLGRMGELGEFSERGHRRVGDAAAHEGINCLVTVGPEAALMAESASVGGLRDVAAVSNVAEAADLLSDIARAEDLILIKGSRSAAMDKILPELVLRRAVQPDPCAP